MAVDTILKPIRFPRALAAWGSPDFITTLKRELEALDIARLPLLHGMADGSVPLDGSMEAMVLTASESEGFLYVKAGIFFTSMIAGCACAGDPAPESENNEYCEVLMEIDKSTARATATLLPND